MGTRRLACLIILLTLNLILGIIYMQPFKAISVSKILSNDSELYTENSVVTTESERVSINATNETFEKIIFPENVVSLSYNFLLNPKDLCSRGLNVKHKLSLLVLVCTAVANFKQRLTIRETWGSFGYDNSTGYVKLAFLLGATKSESLQLQIKQESEKYSDIIQEDFIDSYQNLTLKSIMLLKWVSTFCPNVQYVLKTDDDMYVNIPQLINSLVRLPIKSNVIYGYLFRKAKPNRNPHAKWYVPKAQFEGDMFPDYLSGTGYVMSRDVVPKLYEASANVPFLVMEDVYITGLCASECRVKRYNVKGFAYWRRTATGCAFKDAITGHHVSVKDMIKIWKELQKKPLICHFPKKKL